MIHVMGPAYHNGEELSTDGRNLSLVLLILSRCAATALWTARLRWPDIRPRHRLASVHVNAEVCLPSNWGRKRGRVAGERATGGENFSAAGAGHWLFTPSHGSSAQNRRQTVFYRYNGACIAREGVPLWHNKDKSGNPCVATGWRFVLILFPPKTALKRGLREGVKNQGCT